MRAGTPRGPQGPTPVAVLASGGGTNLQALIDHFKGPSSSACARIALVVSDRPDAGALERATRAGIASEVVEVRGRDSAEVARELLALFERHDIGIVALAGFLRLVPVEIVRHFRGRIVNVHPALLPAFGGAGYYGARVHRALIEAGVTVTGATIHLVEEEYDTGRILAQWPVPVLAADTPETLAARVLEVEHVLYPVVLEALADQLAGREGSGGLRESEATGRGFLPTNRAPTIGEVRAALGL
ncbi:MAG TPA: phosphoribosylglycinamide formyltransferase [Longimicrobiales bacterium]|nr:phosphoribosylglycinamide formyltransferase [Longimicrobiales bacterium]